MWLLSTKHAELHCFSSPDNVPGGYAILSHVWGDNEQTFEDVQALRRRPSRSDHRKDTSTRSISQPSSPDNVRVRRAILPNLNLWRDDEHFDYQAHSTARSTSQPSPRNPRDLMSEKIRRSCELAERHGYEWLWVDTCCINKSSSAELSEAINSMFQYYSEARICYAYLQDVGSNFDERASERQFRRSTWHTRGWTLQELIAPRIVLFVSRTWEIICSKADRAELLETITHVPAAILRFEEPLPKFSVAQRMAWAASRRTSRAEDEAYCLLGIFDINMPTIYGEGKKAFRRLQEEIMKQSPDTTLFAWGARCEYSQLFLLSSKCDSYLFAASPSDFAGCASIVYTPPSHATRRPRGLVSDIGSSFTLSSLINPSGLVQVPTIPSK